MPVLQPVQRKSLPDHVFEQLSGEIVVGRLGPGRPLPTERELCDRLQVSRTAVREAVRRLEQSGLVATQQGALTRVLDYRKTGGLDLLPQLLVLPDGDIDLRVVRSVMEMRSAMAPDAARLAALRVQPAHQERLKLLEISYRSVPKIDFDSDATLNRLGDLGLELWDLLCEASGNIAYQLAFNSLRRVYEPVRPVTNALLADELRDVDGCCALIVAVHGGEGDAAFAHATRVIARGLRATLSAIDALETADTVPLTR